MAKKSYKKKLTKKVIEEAPVIDTPAVEEIETIAPTPKSRPASAPKQRDLTRGSNGDDVAKVQSAIGVPATGEFDFGTLVAVKKWQKVNGLTADGVVGPKTREKLL